MQRGTSTKENSFKYIMFLSMIYILILFASAVIGNKIVKAPLTALGSFSAASITGPLWFTLSSVVAEVYGKRVSIQMFISAMICELIFMFICVLMIHLPSPDWWHHQNDYNYVIGHFLQIYFYQLIAIIIAWHVNIRLITYWGFLLKGDYFWLRNIGASGIGEIIFSIISVSLNTFGLVPIEQLPKIVAWSCALKLIFIIIFSYPASLAVAILRKVEKIEPKTYDVNPYKEKELQTFQDAR